MRAAREIADRWLDEEVSDLLAEDIEKLVLAAEQRGAEREREKWVNWLRDANSEPPIAALVD
jgi:hypothetical protein